VGAARFLVSEGMAALEVRLEPPALGRIRLTTVLERGQLTLTIAPDSLAAHEVLRAAAPDIEALLTARGLTATVSLTAPGAEPADRRPGGRRDGERGARRDPDHSAGSRRREGERPRLAFVDLVA
jgi:hypothetical protein